MSTQSPYRETCARCADLEAQVRNKNEIIDKLGEDLKTSNRRAWMDFLKSFGVWIVEHWAGLATFAFFTALIFAMIWGVHYEMTKPPPSPEQCITSAKVIHTGYSHLCPGGTITTEKLDDDKVLVRCTCSPPPDPDAEP